VKIHESRTTVRYVLVERSPYAFFVGFPGESPFAIVESGVPISHAASVTLSPAPDGDTAASQRLLNAIVPRHHVLC
jgi:hypothetical protein